LQDRWEELISAKPDARRTLFKETRDRNIASRCTPIPGTSIGIDTIAQTHSSIPQTFRVSFRSFDRQILIADSRVVDFPRPELWQTMGPEQIYVSEQHTAPIDDGPGLVFSALVPNVHNFNGRGGRILPLYRDTEGAVANLPPQLRKTISAQLGLRIRPEDVLAYIACVTAHGGYTRRFAEELRSPGIRVPVTLTTDLWTEAVEIGKRVIWLHTFRRAHGQQPTATTALPRRIPVGRLHRGRSLQRRPAAHERPT
jgi:predicted helicase